MIRKALVLLLLLAIAIMPCVTGCSREPSGPEFPDGLFGTVFDDTNANGVRDEGEPGIGGVVVSNGIHSRPTNDAGEYNLPAEGSLLFITTPRDCTPTGHWYGHPSSDNLDFALRYTPEKDSSEFTFAQMSDIHLDQEHGPAFIGLADELNQISPDFVVSTGDLIFDGNTATVAQADKWFELYENVTSTLSMPIYSTVGNHDVVGIGRQDMAPTDPGYGEGAFVHRFGPTYYSFDWGRYHCIILDPNDMVAGKQLYRIPDSQLQWLQDDLKCYKKAPALVFFHEPTVSWTNRNAVVDILRGHSAKLFCGHLHQDVSMAATDASELVTAAVSGEWWKGANPDGSPAGYRLVSVKGDQVDSIYRGTGDERTVDFGLPPILDGEVQLAVKIYSRHGAVSAATYAVDDGEAATMNLEDGHPWTLATASWDTTSLEEGYHSITVKVSDALGSFDKQMEFKRSETKTLPLSDMTAHRQVYQGSPVTIEGKVGLIAIGPDSEGGIDIPDGVGLLLMTDGKDMLVVIAGELFSPSLADHKSQVHAGDKVIVRVVPLRLSMVQATSTREWAEYYPLFKDFIGYLPASAREPSNATSIDRLVAVWGARWLTPDDLALASP